MCKNSTKILCMAAVIIAIIFINTEVCESLPAPEGDVSALDTYGCPLNSLCKKHCINEAHARTGQCDGPFKKNCHCIGVGTQ
ncbi:unnamed protein product [Medioppia subpectinata]|uniref:Defensin n=1 Tax=Medioppia subpectinata TaxID=1979941 RepID=A0A7R9LE32_9ACAR|nr:unnamed protein product [Medioppia subpectinata]CAG2118058.1 unnamed protein product [Medioppia subpectinata]